MPVGDAFFCAVEGKPRGVAPCPHQRLCLWTPRRVFDPLDTHFAMELSALSGYARVLIRPLSRRSGQRGLAAIKVNKHGCAPEGVKGAIGKPPCRARRREIPCLRKRATMVARPTMWSRPFGATICGKLDRAAWGRSCGSAKLLAGTLRCLHLCWRLPWNWSPAQQLGRCPKPHKGRRPLTLQGTDEKGRSPPLTLFSAPDLVALPYFFFSGAFFAFSFAFFS